MLASLWILTFLHYSNLPATIPYHFTISGQADGFAKKESIFILHSIISILILVMKILGQYSSLSNYGKNIPVESYNENLKLGTRIDKTIILGIGAIFLFTNYEVTQNGLGKPIGIGRWFIPSIIIIIFIPTTLIIYKTT